MSNNPIKHVQFSMSDYFQPPKPRGGLKKCHKEVTSEFINELVQSLSEIECEMNRISHDYFIGCSVAVVELEDKAISKSHRPVNIFNDLTCPFFGDIGFGKFLIKTTPEGLRKLKNKIKKSNSHSFKCSVSSIKSIQSYIPNINIDHVSDSLSIRLFRYDDAILNKNIDTFFESILNDNGIAWYKHPSEVIRLYKVSNENKLLASKLIKFSAIQSIASSQSISVSPMLSSSSDDYSIPTMTQPLDGDFPVIGVVDTAVSSECSMLEPWIINRLSCVPDSLSDYSHGTFVSGLITNGYYLNEQNISFPLSQAKVLSVEVISNAGGDIYDIVNAMYDAAVNNPDIKVWNLSLGTNEPVTLDAISDMALMLDEFQDKFDCLCVIAAGNFESEYPREWPPIYQYEDRITSPGDSVRGLTIGSIAHEDGFVKFGEPSHFSRKGPVSNFIQKPELVHFGGNIKFEDTEVTNLGLRSVSENGQIKRDMGTSFSTPLISSIAANLFYRIGDNATPSLVKGLLVHSASLGNSIPEDHKPYYGWGVPSDTDEILAVNDYESTFVMDGIAVKSFEVEKLPFPIPECLRTSDGKVRAEFFITLVYTPELNPQKAFEYCQIDLNVGLGSIKNGKFSSVVPLKSSNYEQHLTKVGDKWSPIKVYQKTFPQGVNVKDWRLRVSLLNRDGYEAEGVDVPFSIIITIRDIDKEKPVYNEMSLLMDQYNWEVSELANENKVTV